MTVWLVWDGYKHEGQEMRGVFATVEAATEMARGLVEAKRDAAKYVEREPGRWYVKPFQAWVVVEREEVRP